MHFILWKKGELQPIYNPIRFFVLAFFLTWVPWFSAAYYSHQANMATAQLLCLMTGLLGPFLAMLILIFGANSKELVRDFRDRLRFRIIKLPFLAAIVSFMPLMTLLATGISLGFGYSIEQFAFSRSIHLLEGHGLVGLLILLIAPTLEELGWRGYGIDSIGNYFNVLTATILFGALWAAWHLPLFFINNYYHHELYHKGIVYVVNFFLSIFPGAILMNWVYYKNHRSIIAAILFHFIINLSAVLFQTEQFTKCILTILMLITSIFVIAKDRKLFFTKHLSLCK